MEQMNRQLSQDTSRTKAPNVMRFGNKLQEFLTSSDSETEVVLQVGVGQVARLQKNLIFMKENIQREVQQTMKNPEKIIQVSPKLYNMIPKNIKEAKVWIWENIH